MIKMFYLKSCPYCKQAFKFLDELKDEFPNVEMTLIEETEQPEIANAHDYYYVPTFYINDKKVHEGATSREIIRDILKTNCEK